MLIDVIGPLLDSHDDTLSHGFWERHYVGGSHVRIRLRAAPELLDEVVAKFRESLERWLTAHPTSTLERYSVDGITKVLRADGIDPGAAQLEQLHDVVIERSYPEHGRTYASAGARQLAEYFRRARGPLALRILCSTEPRIEVALKLVLALALFVGNGRFPPGSVSFKSHWEHIALNLPGEVLDRVRANYERRRPKIVAAMNETKREWTNGRFHSDHLLADWWELLKDSHEQATTVLESGQTLVRDPVNFQQPAGGKTARRRSAFVEAMWAQAGFAEAVHHELRFQRPRALVNLLYELIAAIGLRPIDRIMLCHHVFTAVEETSHCSLDSLMKRNIDAALRRG